MVGRVGLEVEVEGVDTTEDISEAISDASASKTFPLVPCSSPLDPWFISWPSSRVDSIAGTAGLKEIGDVLEKVEGKRKSKLVLVGKGATGRADLVGLPKVKFEVGGRARGSEGEAVV
jgi:hypothetical protein